MRIWSGYGSEPPGEGAVWFTGRVATARRSSVAVRPSAT